MEILTAEKLIAELSQLDPKTRIHMHSQDGMGYVPFIRYGFGNTYIIRPLPPKE